MLGAVAATSTAEREQRRTLGSRTAFSRGLGGEAVTTSNRNSRFGHRMGTAAGRRDWTERRPRQVESFDEVGKRSVGGQIAVPTQALQCSGIDLSPAASEFKT